MLRKHNAAIPRAGPRVPEETPGTIRDPAIHRSTHNLRDEQILLWREPLGKLNPFEICWRTPVVRLFHTALGAEDASCCIDAVERNRIDEGADERERQDPERQVGPFPRLLDPDLLDPPKPTLDATSHEALRVLVEEVHVAALEATRKEHAIGVLDQIDELLLGTPHHGVVRTLRLSDPRLGLPVVDQVLAEEHAHIVELEPLRGVDAADLLDSLGIVRPESFLGDTRRESSGIGAGIPRSPEVADDDVGNQSTVWLRLRPLPAEARREPG